MVLQPWGTERTSRREVGERVDERASAVGDRERKEGQVDQGVGWAERDWWVGEVDGPAKK